MSGWTIALIVVVSLSVLINLVAFIMEKVYKKKIMKNFENNEN